MKLKQNIIKAGLVVGGILLVALTVLFWPKASESNSTTPTQQGVISGEKTSIQVVTNQQTQTISNTGDGTTVRIRAIGDILLHDFVYNTVRSANGYNFNSMLEPVKRYIENADITIANMETIVAGEQIGLGTYPLFNAPAEILDTLKYVGVDIVNNTSNHTMDMGGEGALLSIQQLKKHGMPYVGSYESWNDYNTPRILEANGIKVGFLAYTYGLNGLELPEGQEYLATLIDTELIPLEIKALKEKVDVSVVIIQNGEEYLTLPTENQLMIHGIARDAGASFVLGGHPHVMEPFIYYNESQAGILSHGNFLTGQYEPATKVGGITEFTFRKLSSGQVVLDSMRFMPTYNIGLPEFDTYSVVPLADWQKYGIPNGEALLQEIRERMTTFTNKVEVVDYLD